MQKIINCDPECPLFVRVNGNGYCCSESDFDDAIDEIKRQAENDIAEIENAQKEWLNREIEIEVNDEKE